MRIWRSSTVGIGALSLLLTAFFGCEGPKPTDPPIPIAEPKLREHVEDLVSAGERMATNPATDDGACAAGTSPAVRIDVLAFIEG